MQVCKWQVAGGLRIVGGSPGYLETRNQGNRVDSLTPVYRSTGFPAYRIYFQSRHHARPRADTDENASRPGWRGKPSP